MAFFKKHPAFVVLLALALLCAAIWFAVYATESKRGGMLTFAVLDVGQGDALFIQGPTGIQVLVDAGPNTGAILRELPKVIRWWDRTLDAAIETHPDADHMGGFLDVFDRYKVGAFVTPGIVKRNTTTDALDKAVAAERSLIYIARRGMVVDLGGGARLEVLYPDSDASGLGERSNDGSIVMRLAYGSTSAMLTGDAPLETENYLIATASSSLASSLLKVGHHGSKTSTGELFLKAVSPRAALISAGKDNRYGHPTAEVLGRLTQAGIPIMRTDREGTIICVSNAIVFTCN